MSKIITMIPVRMASTRLPDKPLLDVNGKSVLQRVYENVRAVIPGDVVIAAGDQVLVDEAEKFGDREMIITLYIDSDKGDVIGVHFNFSNITGYANVPVSKYREIELELKKYIHFTPTELGRQLKVIMICWSQRPGVFKLPPSPLRPVED